MSDDEWVVASRSKGKKKKTATKTIVATTATQRLQNLEEENKDLRALSEKEQTKRSQRLFHALFKKADEIACSAFALDSILRLLNSHPALQGVSLTSLLPSLEGPQYFEEDAPLVDLENWRDVLLRSFALAHRLTPSPSSTSRTYPVFSSSICLGVGSIGSSRVAQAQLGFYLLLTALFSSLSSPLSPSLLTSPVTIYDPVLNYIEIKTLTSVFGLTVPSLNDEGKTVFSRSGNSKPLHFAYLPHCGAGLSSNILWANWGASLKDIVLLANSSDRSLSTLKMGSSSGKITPVRTDASLLPHVRAVVEEVTEGFAPSLIDSSFYSSMAFPGDPAGEFALGQGSSTQHNWVTLARVASFLNEIPLIEGKNVPVSGAFNDTSIHWLSLVDTQHTQEKEKSSIVTQAVMKPSLTQNQLQSLMRLHPPEYVPERHPFQMIDGRPVSVSVTGEHLEQTVVELRREFDPEIITRSQKPGQ